MLVTSMFSCPGLDWNSPGESVELFAGDCSITKGEWKDYKLGSYITTLPSIQRTKGVNNQAINWACISFLGAQNISNRNQNNCGPQKSWSFSWKGNKTEFQVEWIGTGTTRNLDTQKKCTCSLGFKTRNEPS